jgi:hypothetical protein
MIILQKFGFKESRYERPQDAWICGRLADGNPCELGPSLNGQCCATSGCQPRLEKDRWLCRRPASAGGCCEAGPLPDGQCCVSLEPCVPRRSLRSKRKRGTMAAVALVVGILAVFLGGEEGRHFMMPGKLSSHHAGLTDCSTCHSGAQPGKVDLLHRLMTAVEPRQNSNLCLTCHVMGAEPFSPHTHSVEDLKRRTERLRLASRKWQPESLMQRIAFPATVKSRGADAEIQCAICHKEHQGVFANLKAVSNQRCQTCHVSRFDTLADSHPQFVKFPYQRRPRIAFDHQSHMNKHFPEALKAAIPGQAAPDNCSDCHNVGVRQKYMEVKPFATMCSGCHGGDITGATQVSGSKGIDVLVVPGLDVATLAERGIDIGTWPKESEAALTPFMKLLLEADGNGTVSGVAGLDLLDLRKASDQDLGRVAALAWAIKHLFNWFETTNPSNAKVLAGDGVGKQVDHLQMAAMTGGMSHDVIMAGNREWFPDLQDDLRRHDRGEPTRDFKPTAVKPAADAARAPAPPIGDTVTRSPGADILATSDKKDDILGTDNKADSLSPGRKGETIVPKKDDILSDDKKDKGDILAPSKQEDVLVQKKDDILASGDKPAANNDILSGAGDGSADLSKGDANTGADVKKSTDTAPTPFDPEVWAQTGGWYRADFTIRYRPVGHADQFLRTWLDFAGRAYGTNLQDRLAPVFNLLSPKDAIGRCTKCHSVDDEAGAKSVNWLPFDPNAIKNRFTNYSHKPHVELIGTKTCAKCHELQQSETPFMKTYEAGDPVNYTPNFKPIDKAVCSACHSQQTAWENCTLCHGYHVLDVNAKSPMRMLPDSSDKATFTNNSAMPPSESDADARRVSAIVPPDESAPVAADALTPSRPAIDDPRESMSAPPGGSKPVVPDSSAEVAVVKPASPSPDNGTRAVPDDSMQATVPDKLAAVTPESSKIQPSSDASGGEPADLEGFLRRGLDRAVHGNFELARRDFDEVIRRDPRHAGALDDRCWVLAVLDEVQAALKDCDASLQAAPNFADALDSRGFVNLKLGFYQKAITDYSAALSQFRGAKRAAALYGRGIAKRRSGNAAGAKSDIVAAKAIRSTIAEEFASYGIQ